ncbi:ribbon-helix-helix protein, CopG family [uncultured Sphingomonas sp.]|uniref:ribbon-helix-helix protein, CopG family n=1 Tax=uncultured Sphingomonas sp. TaxID=158754 RepID=UPI0035CAE7D5
MLGLRLDGDTEAKLARLARREGRTKSDLVRDALKSYLRHAEDDEALIAEVRRIAARTPDSELNELDFAADDLEALIDAEEAGAVASRAA